MNQYDPSTAAGMAYDEIREGQRQRLNGLCPSDATPCSQSCPKCGSNDISRKTRLKGEIWHEYNERQRSNYLIFVGKIRSKARQDCVQAWCRECAYAWEVSAMDSDRRCPYWQLANEAMSTLEAMEFDGELSPPEMDFLSRLKAAFPIPLNADGDARRETHPNPSDG